MLNCAFSCSTVCPAIHTAKADFFHLFCSNSWDEDLGQPLQKQTKDSGKRNAACRHPDFLRPVFAQLKVGDTPVLSFPSSVLSTAHG